MYKASALIPPLPTIVKSSLPISTVSISQPSKQEGFSSHEIISNYHPLSLFSVLLSITNNIEEDTANFQRQEPWENTLQSLKFVNDEVVRVLDPNTVKLKRNGLVTFGAIQTPSGYNSASFRYPECMTKLPSSKARQILPPGTRVGIYFADGGKVASESQGQVRPRAALVITKDTGKLVNAELVRFGFARPMIVSSSSSHPLGAYDTVLPGLIESLGTLQKEAKEKGLGIYRQCEDIEKNVIIDSQFEELQFSLKTQWGEDGGKPILVEKQRERGAEPPTNPGDKRGCSDFRFYEDALRYYEKYYPYYGDVARLDRDKDGIPCEGLPHTTTPEKYRMKKPR